MKIALNGSILELPESSTAADALRKAGINQETVLVKRAGGLIADIEQLKEGDVIETISVISGG
ncbi:MAG: MoaD/ThiS family protein [Candidatus Aenigmarchaeota archaeon]|nr:MoaD/ThiS family protein [Candidatus Aenigmarchaeota archaeon]